MMPEVRQLVILTIEDECSIRESFRNFLEDLDYVVIEAGDGRQGLEAFRKASPDLVLVDLRMPEVDGLEVLKTVTEESPNTPVIVISGTGRIADAVEALRLGAWNYLLKPIEDMSVFHHAIENALERSRLIEENQRYREYLEAEVTERTQKLEEANQKLQQINHRLRRLVETTRDLSVCLQVEEFGSRLLAEFGRHMLATGGSLYLMEPDGLHLVDALDPGHAVAHIPKPISPESIIGRAVESCKPVLISDIARSAGYNGSGWHGYSDGSILVFPLPDQNGQVAGILSLHSKSDPPFTEQDKEIGSILASYSCEALRASQTAEALKENVEKYQLLTENLRDVVVSLSPDGYLTYCSPVSKEFGGYDPEEAIGKHFSEYFADPGELQNILPFLEKIREDPVVGPVEFMYLPKTGKPFPVEVSGKALINKEGEVAAIQCVMRDIRERRNAQEDRERLEKQLRQAQKMESIGTLAGGIAHDFNNILSSVIGYTELGLTQLDGRDPVKRNLDAVLKAGNRAKKLVGQILTFSRQGEQVFIPVRVDTITKEALKLLRSSIPVTIKIEQNIQPSGFVMADTTQIHQVVMNLCTNAYHAMQDSGGTLSVDIRPCEIRNEDLKNFPELSVGQYLRLSVSDTGTGMSAAVVEKIFEPYFTTKEKGKGTGLGLSVVHGIVKSHRGMISVSSRSGHGTCFKVYLPITNEVVTDFSNSAAALPVGNERVLFVDDEKEIVQVGQQMLDQLGYDVTTCTNSREALSLFKEQGNQFDAVITDFTMPEITGDELARELIRFRKDIPIILCTGFSDRINEKKAREIGIRKFLLKPASMIDLASAIREVLDSKP